MLRRRAALLMLVISLGVVGSVFYALQQQHVYEATAVLEITAPPVEEAAATGGQATGRLIQQIQQRLMARDNVLAMIEDYGLFADAPAMSESDRVTAFRASVSMQSVESVRITGQSGNVSALRITARLDSPELAAMVANDLAASVMELRARGSEERTQSVLEFYSAEERRLGAEIDALEEEVRDFKVENDELLPDTLASRRDRLTRLRERVLDLDSEIATLERERATLASEPARGVVQRQIDQIDDELADLSEERALLQANIEEILDTIRRTPEIERMLSAQERRLQQLRDQYSVATNRRAEAEMGQRLETEQRAERFEILETAMAPEYPSGTSRRNVAVAGTMLSAAVAFVIAMVLEFLNPLVRSAAQMRRALDLRPVVSIPFVQTPLERRRQHLFRLGAFIALAMAILLAAALTLGNAG